MREKKGGKYGKLSASFCLKKSDHDVVFLFALEYVKLETLLYVCETPLHFVVSSLFCKRVLWCILHMLDTCFFVLLPPKPVLSRAGLLFLQLIVGEEFANPGVSIASLCPISWHPSYSSVLHPMLLLLEASAVFPGLYSSTLCYSTKDINTPFYTEITTCCHHIYKNSLSIVCVYRRYVHWNQVNHTHPVVNKFLL